MLDELAGAVDLLEGIGFPFALTELGLLPDDVLLPFRNIRLLRRRYSTFDLAYDLGLEDTMRKSGDATSRHLPGVRERGSRIRLP